MCINKIFQYLSCPEPSNIRDFLLLVGKKSALTCNGIPVLCLVGKNAYNKPFDESGLSTLIATDTLSFLFCLSKLGNLRNAFFLSSFLILDSNIKNCLEIFFGLYVTIRSFLSSDLSNSTVNRSLPFLLTSAY